MAELKYGWVGKILKVDLTKGTVTTVPTSDYAPELIGGRGIGAMLYWEEVPPECKALDPESALIFMTGPATGTLAPSAGRFCVSFKTPVPVKEFYTMSVPGGHWGPELKFAGYDGIVIKGKASEPVYLWIHDGEVEIRSARYLWGMTLTNLMLQLYKQHGPKTRILGIGPAGENLCREAVIINDHEHATGLGGAGAVMGSKNLKAIAVRGTGAVNVAKPKELMDLWWHFSRLVTRKPGEKEFPSIHRSLCDGLYHAHIHYCPGHPARPQDDETYFKNMGLDDPICLMTDAINKGIIKLKWGGCYSCPVNCALTWQSSDIDIPSGSGQCNEWMSWATYEWAEYGKVCGIPALQFSSYVDDLGLSITNTLGYHFHWFFELVKLGIFTEENTGVPLDKPWTVEFIKGVLENFAYRKGIFDKAAEGHERFLKSLSEEYPAVKPIYDRVVNHPGYHVHWEIPGAALNRPPSPFSIVHATESRIWQFRPSHLARMGIGAPAKNGAERMNIPRVPPSLKDNMPTTVLYHNLDINSDCVTYCSWAGMPPSFSKYTPDGIGDQAVGAKVFSAVTGINMSHDEMMAAMNLIYNIERCIHIREGRRKEDDLYNDATFESPGWAHTSKEEFIEAMEEYYRLRGWDPETGIPRRSTLEKQGLKRIADDLESKYGVASPL